MRLFQSLEEWTQFRRTLPSTASIGFVPTLGHLHAGHASLFKASVLENEYTVGSIFLNPTQFNQVEDLAAYPRTLEADQEIMLASQVDFCLLPTEAEIYADAYVYQVQEHQLSQLMEGISRPGHFNGVLTVVIKLLNLVRPDRAYFGEKDYQQYLLIQGMVQAFFMNVIIRSCPTIREPSGLAYSSRNHRLTTQQKVLAGQFARILHQEDRSCEEVVAALKALEGIEVEYVEEHFGRRFAAVIIGGVRLIDNVGICCV